MKRFLSLAAVTLFCLALAPPQQQVQVRTVGRLNVVPSEGLVLSPNGRFLAMTTADSILVMEVASGRHWTVLRRQSRPGTYEFGAIDWSPKGDLLAFNRADEDERTSFVWSLPIDQNTGRATGEARRVSISGADVVAFSPDGESLVYVWGRRLFLAPSRGGLERLLIQLSASVYSLGWSDDGQWIHYYAGGVFSRVSVAGGDGQLIYDETGRGFRPGGQGFVTRDRRPAVINGGALIVAREADRMIRIKDATGTQTKALFRAAQGAGVELTTANANATRFYAMSMNTPNRLVAVSLANGATRHLDTSQEPHGVATADSGNRIVFHNLAEGVRRIVAIDANGSGRREYQLRHRPQGIGTLSPDGTRLAFPAVDSVQRLILLDLSTGSERELAAGRGILSQNPRWRSDGQLQYVQLDPATRTRTVHEVTIDGRDRVVRTFENPPPSGFGLLNDTLAILATRGLIELVPLPRGDPRIIFRGPHAGAVLSPDHRFLAVKTSSKPLSAHPDSTSIAQGDADVIAIVDLGSGQRRNITLDFRMQVSVSNAGSRVHALWRHPDGRNLIVNMSNPGVAVEDVYRVPLNGDRPRLIQRGLTSDTRAGLLPDGKTVVVSLRSPTATDILEFTLPGAGRGRSRPGTR